MKKDKLDISEEVYSNFKKLAGYQIIGGLIGIGLIIWLTFKTEVLDLASVVVLSLMMLLFLYSFFCGVRLIQAKENALKFSLINQCIQVFGFSILGFGFTYVSGLYLTVEFDFTEIINFNFGLGVSKFGLTFNSDSDTLAFNVNIIALLLIYWITKLMKKVKTEIDIGKSDTIGTDLIPQSIEN